MNFFFKLSGEGTCLLLYVSVIIVARICYKFVMSDADSLPILLIGRFMMMWTILRER